MIISDLAETLKEYKSNHLPIELLYSVTGVFLLLILNYLFKPTSEVYPNWIYFNDTQRAVTIIIFAYFLARACNEVGKSVINFGSNCLRTNKRKHFKKFLTDLKDYVNYEVRSLDSERLNHAEIDNFIHNHGGIAFEFSRHRYSIMIKQIFLGFSLGLGIFYSYYFLLLALVLLISSILEGMLARENRIEVAAFYLKQRKDGAK